MSTSLILFVAFGIIVCGINCLVVIRIKKEVSDSVTYARLYCKLLEMQQKYYMSLRNGSFANDNEIKNYIDATLAGLCFLGFELHKVRLKAKKPRKEFALKAMKLTDAELEILYEISLILEQIIRIKNPLYYYYVRLKKIAFGRILSLFIVLMDLAVNILMFFDNFRAERLKNNSFLEKDKASKFMLQYKL